MTAALVDDAELNRQCCNNKRKRRGSQDEYKLQIKSVAQTLTPAACLYCSIQAWINVKIYAQYQKYALF